uniref:Uncharacterized protein n=1 Tax=Picea glauca TaxID=3330 RepID=A0A101LTM9_PICGL|nr:hypothetical protein ABT39_MTgene3636 [Picea glauca]
MWNTTLKRCKMKLVGNIRLLAHIGGVRFSNTLSTFPCKMIDHRTCGRYPLKLV